jgi:hypothetical protein
VADDSVLLRTANEARVRDLEAKVGHPGSLENAFDVLRILIFLDAITINLGIFDATLGHFEEARSDMLTEMERRTDELLAARDLAQQRALAEQRGANRQQRRHPGPQGIARP